jgi:hypothetical protein
MEQMKGNIKVIHDFPHRRYSYFDVVVRFVLSMFLRDTGRAAHFRHVKGDDPD